MKINPIYWVILVSTMLLGTSAHAEHDASGAEAVLMPIQKCFTTIQAYRELSIFRKAGLTLEEVEFENELSIRVLKYLSSVTPDMPPYDEAVGQELRDMTVEIYAIPEEDFVSDDFLSDWATVKFDECVSKIDLELLQPPEPSNEQIERMLPDMGA